MALLRAWLLVVATALLGLLALFAALTSGWQAVREYRAVAGLPRLPRAPKCRLDRVGYRPRLQCELLRLVSATPRRTSRGGLGMACSTTAPWRRPLDLSLALLLHDWPVAVQD